MLEKQTEQLNAIKTQAESEIFLWNEKKETAIEEYNHQISRWHGVRNNAMAKLEYVNQLNKAAEKAQEKENEENDGGNIDDAPVVDDTSPVSE